MIRVPEPDPPEVRSRPTWPTPLGRCRAMPAEVRAVNLRAAVLALWLEPEDDRHRRALLVM